MKALGGFVILLAVAGVCWATGHFGVGAVNVDHVRINPVEEMSVGAFVVVAGGLAVTGIYCASAAIGRAVFGE